MSSYVELHTASAFSFLQGASLPEALVDRAAACGFSALALLDRDGFYGAPRFHKAATAAGIKPIVGVELTIAPGGVRPSSDGLESLRSADARRNSGGSAEARDIWFPRAGEKAGSAGSRPGWLLPVLCESQEGYRNLCRLISRMKMRAPKGEGALALEELEGFTEGLVVLAGRSLLNANRFGVGGLLDRLIGLFGRDCTFVELQRHYRRDEEADNQLLVEMAAAFRVPIVATNGVRFATPTERPLFDVLTCIDNHTDLAHAGRRLAPNAERYLKPPEDMASLFRDLPHAVERAGELADRLQYTLADLGYRFPDYPVPDGETQASFLRAITEVGARQRYRPYHDRARRQVARELDLIEKLALSGYFLIVWDIVNFCRQHDILVQGRGSAANSAVCYSLGITAVDPVGMDLLFERFLSEERGEWPDIDLDLPSGDRREAVIQHVYEKYGRLGAAMTANVITYRDRSAAREVGKALGFETAAVDRLAKVMNNFEFVDAAETLPRHLATVGLDIESERVQLFARLWRDIQYLPRHLGQHSGGMVICEGRLDAVVPLENATMPGRVVVQWDKDDCADMGIVKVDLLGLGMMAVLQDAIAMVNGDSEGASFSSSPEGEGLRSSPRDSEAGPGSGSAEARDTSNSGGRRAAREEDVVGPQRRFVLDTREGNSPSASGMGVGPHAIRIDLAHLPQDPAVYRLMCEADTIGVFQVESRAQMATLPRLKPAQFYDIVVQVAIIRPGPIVGQMVHPYLNRRAGREPVVYPHPSLEPILARTLGVPLFQEQLLRMAMVAAGFTGGQAEELRRAFGFKRSERRMAQIEVQLREGMARQGIVGSAAAQIISSITSFALYGFPESHAASFALLAYASAYLKVHYPAAFYTALLNNQPMGFYHPSTLVKDAQRRGIRFQPIDVQFSDWDCTVEEDGSIRLGLRYVSGLRQEIGKAIARERAVSRGRESPREPEAQRSTRRRESRKVCPKCGCDDESMLERTDRGWFCNVCSYEGVFEQCFVSLDALIRRTGLRRDEIVVLADIGALNSFGYDRRSALWQAERAVRPAGELFHSAEGESLRSSPRHTEASPLVPMAEAERMVADYAGTGLTIGRHPMALRRDDLAMRGILRALDLRSTRHGRRVRVAGMVITRQRPGTAKGFVFLTLEDETGIANIIVRPDLFARDRLLIIEEPFLIVEGVLQTQDGVISVRAEAVQGMRAVDVDFEAHDFY